MSAAEIKFGVEIECYVPRGRAGERFVAGAYHRGLQINEAPTGWNGQRDGSLSSSVNINGRAYRPVEVVSPILSGLDGLAQIFYVVEMLQSAGAIVNEKCGLHVHVDGSGIKDDPAAITRLVYEFRAFENVLLAVNGDKAQQRLNNYYCKLSNEWRGDPFVDRYRSLNLTNLARRKGTVEFRLFAAEIDPEFIITVVYMAVAMVAKVQTSLDLLPVVTSNMTPLQRAVNFVERYWSDVQNLIIPEDPTDDIETVLLHRVAQAGI